MIYHDTLIRFPAWMVAAPNPTFSVPVEEHHLPDQMTGYTIGGTLYLPRWLYLLWIAAKRDHIKALDLLAERYVEEIDRRLKEKNL